MRFVHAADLHLDSPLRGLSRLGDSGLATTLRAATRRACENLVDAVVDSRAEALVLPGDVYDGDWKDYATGAFFVRQLSRLHDEGIPVFLISGNHDAESEITRSLRLPPNTHRLSVDAPETVVDDDLGLAVHGQGFARRAVLENLVPAYPDRIPGLVNVGMLHTSVQGDDRHDTYAPCRPEDLSGCGYEYFALGHVHEQRAVCDGPHPAWFSGTCRAATRRSAARRAPCSSTRPPSGGRRSPRWSSTSPAGSWSRSTSPDSAARTRSTRPSSPRCASGAPPPRRAPSSPR